MPNHGQHIPLFGAAAPDLRWDTACDLLGGADWSSVPELVQSFPPFRARFSVGRQFLFQDDPVRLPLECLWLKLSGFACLCRATAEFYRQHQRPHLSLTPEQIRVHPSDPTFTWLPARWLFAVNLDEGQGSTPLVHETMRKEMAQEIFVSSGEIDPTYTAPAIKQWPMGRELPVTVLLRSVERIPDDVDEQASRGLIRAHMFSDEVAFADFSEHDVFHITLRLPGSGTTKISLWARKVEEAERGLVVSGVTDAIPQVAWSQLERAKQQVLSDARTEVFRAFDHACDLYSLGTLLFRCLLVNPSRPFEVVQHELSAVLERLEPLVQGLEPDDHWTRFTRVSGRLKEQRDIFAPPSDCLSEFAWYDALIYGLRLTSRIPGFGFCGNTESRDTAALPGALHDAMQGAEHLAEQARIDLFEAAARHRELLRICDLVLAERM
jgi:hypothetical protein